MREQLIRYVDLLFAGAENAYEIKQEILQNTLDRYDDLIAQGKSPEAAYRLSISGIGDINEILSGSAQATVEQPMNTAQNEENQKKRRMLHAISVAAWILTPIPLFLIGDEVGLCLTLILISLATALNIYAKKMYPVKMNAAASNTATGKAQKAEYSPKQELRRSISTVMSLLSIAAYIGISILLDMWIPTLLMFPLFGAIMGIIFALIDLKEANDNEK